MRENVILEIKDVVKRVENKLVLDDFGLTLKEEQCLGLIGPSGSGKTTAIYCILSLFPFEKGNIMIFGQPMNQWAYNIKKKIGVVLENTAVFTELTVYENITYFCNLYERNRKKAGDLAEETMKILGLMEYHAKYPSNLSTGLLKRLNMACGIAHNPKLLILDNPFSGCDYKSKDIMLEVIQKLKEQKVSLLYASNGIKEAEFFCDNIAFIDKGKVVVQGTKTELLKMISLGEKIEIQEVFLTEEQKKECRMLPAISMLEYENRILYIKAKRGHNALLSVLTYFTQNGISYGKIVTQPPALCDIFFEITGKQLE